MSSHDANIFFSAALGHPGAWTVENIVNNIALGWWESFDGEVSVQTIVPGNLIFIREQNSWVVTCIGLVTAVVDDHAQVMWMALEPNE